jgi:hypothetical protein
MAGLLHLLLSDCPDSAVLATSREPLRMEAEQVFLIETLNAEANAHELFARRAVEADSSFDPSSHAAAIATVCTALDGRPLALELAAARLGTMSCKRRSAGRTVCCNLSNVACSIGCRFSRVETTAIALLPTEATLPPTLPAGATTCWRRCVTSVTASWLDATNERRSATNISITWSRLSLQRMPLR